MSFLAAVQAESIIDSALTLDGGDRTAWSGSDGIDVHGDHLVRSVSGRSSLGSGLSRFGSGVAGSGMVIRFLARSFDLMLV